MSVDSGLSAAETSPHAAVFAQAAMQSATGLDLQSRTFQHYVS